MAEVEVGAVAPVENAPAANAVPAPELPTDQENAEAKADESVQPQPKYTDEDLQKKINERLTKERKRIARDVRLELERDHYKQQAEALATPAPKQQQPQGAPREEEFAGRPYREYIEALTDWKLEQRSAKDREAFHRQQETQNQQRVVQEQARYVHENIIAKGQGKHDDFIDVVMGVNGITEPMVASAADLPNGDEVIYHLAHDDAERFRIAALRPAQQAFALKDLSAKLAATPEPSRTPPPIVPNGTKTTVAKDPSKMTDKEFADWRRRQIAQKR